MNTEEIIRQFSPELRKRVQLGSDVKIIKQPVPSIGLNSALRGGLGFGRQVLLWGNKSAGKSSFAQILIGNAQREGRVCAWIDAEQSFDPDWAAGLGVDTDQLLYTASKSVSSMTDDGIQFMKAGADIIVVDSISALVPAAYLDKDEENVKAMHETNAMGSIARDMTKAVNMLNFTNEKTLLIFISQERNTLGGLFVSHAPTGGKAVQFFSSTIIKLWSSASEKKAITQQIQVGDKILSREVGRKVTWVVDFNKTGPAFVSGEYDFYFDGPFIGIDAAGETFDTAVEQGIIQKTGAWFVFPGGDKAQGRDKAVTMLREDEGLQGRVAAMLG